MFNTKLSTLKNGTLRAGQTVLIPSRSVLDAARDVPNPSVEIYRSASRSTTRVHVVKRGETLSGIARRYGTSVAALKRLNGLKRDAIQSGQRLRVRSTGTPARPTARSSASKATKRSSGS
jgi:LysM repeat protein